MKKVDIFCSFFLILVGFVFLIGAARLGIGAVSAPGPGLIPFGAAALLILFSLGTIGEALFASRPDAGSPAKAGPGRNAAVLALVSLFAYALLLNALGFLLATFLLLTVLFRLSEEQTWKLALAESAVTTALTFLLFDYALKCSFPRGILEFTGF